MSNQLDEYIMAARPKRVLDIGAEKCQVSMIADAMRKFDVRGEFIKTDNPEVIEKTMSKWGGEADLIIIRSEDELKGAMSFVTKKSTLLLWGDPDLYPIIKRDDGFKISLEKQNFFVVEYTPLF